jgi:hypothetical protein
MFDVRIGLGLLNRLSVHQLGTEAKLIPLSLPTEELRLAILFKSYFRSGHTGPHDNAFSPSVIYHRCSFTPFFIGRVQQRLVSSTC